MEELAKKYNCYSLDRTYNVGLFRITHGRVNPNKIKRKRKHIHYGNKGIIKFVHTHFDRELYNVLNDRIKTCLKECGRIEELNIINGNNNTMNIQEKKI